MKFSIALDLGTSYLKAGLVTPDGNLLRFFSLPAPPVKGDGLICERDAEAYLHLCHLLLEQVGDGSPPGTSLGIASQRSSFLVWERSTGKPVTPLISWRDRRGDSWCRRHVKESKTIREITGLPLSPHYVGPKLAVWMSENPGHAERIRKGEHLVGTLETYLLWKWSGGRAYETDLTMASRTLLADIDSGSWSDRLLQLFGIERNALPKIVPTSGRAVELDSGFMVTTTIADQAACALASFDGEPNGALINLGTGIFVLCPTGKERKSLQGYCTTVIHCSHEKNFLYSLEGTINGVGPLGDPFTEIPVDFPGVDPAPETFCIPDSAGIGSPFWCSDVSYILSQEESSMSSIEISRVRWEGGIFRVREILEDFFPDSAPKRVVLSGGLARRTGLARWLASCLDRRVSVMLEPEQTLLGAARLAAGFPVYAGTSLALFEPEAGGRYLHEKYHRWEAWMKGYLKEKSCEI